MGTDAAGADEEAAGFPGRQLGSAKRRTGRDADLRSRDGGALGLTTQQLDSALYGAFGQSEVSVIYKPLNYYYVVLEVAPQFSQGPEGLKSMYLPTAGGGRDPAVGGGDAAIRPRRLLP